MLITSQAILEVGIFLRYVTMEYKITMFAGITEMSLDSRMRSYLALKGSHKKYSKEFYYMIIYCSLNWKPKEVDSHS